MGCSNSSSAKTIETTGNNQNVNLSARPQNVNKTENEQKTENNGKIEQKVIDVQPKKEENKEKQVQNILKLEVKKEEKKEEISTIKIEQKQEKEERQENNENQVKKPENSQQNTTSVAQTRDNIETDDFDEKNFPVFEYDFFEKHIQNYKRILIEKADNGIINIHKIFLTFNYNENKTKIRNRKNRKTRPNNQTSKKTCFERMFPE